MNKTQPSFAKSVIIPLEIYNQKFQIPLTKQKSTEKFNSADDILSSNLPSDLKMKLFDKNKFEQKTNRNKLDDINREYTIKKNLKESIYELFQNDDKENLKEIFELYIDRNPYIIDWDRDTYEVILYERKLDNTNLVKILQYLFNPQGDKPRGTYQVYRTLIDLGVPSKLFANIFSQGLNDSNYNTPPQWSSLSSTPARKLAPVFNPSSTPQESPIAKRVKLRQDRRRRLPYTPSKWVSL